MLSCSLPKKPFLRLVKIISSNLNSVMHRADYQQVLADEARRLGAEFRLDCEVIKVECNEVSPRVTLANGECLMGDVVVGADGLRSEVRTSVLGHVKEPEESGDLAYRITIPRELLENNPDPFVRDVINGKINAVWYVTRRKNRETCIDSIPCAGGVRM